MKIIRSRGQTLPYITATQFDDYLDGKLTLYWHEALILRPLKPHERTVYDEANQRDYVFQTSNTRMAGSAFYYLCELNCRPNIVIKSKPNIVC